MPPQHTTFRIWHHQHFNANIPQHTRSENARICTGEVSYTLPLAAVPLTLGVIHQLYALPHQLLEDFEVLWHQTDPFSTQSPRTMTIVIKIIISYQNNYSTWHFTPSTSKMLPIYVQESKKRHMTIAEKLDLIEQNQCDFWIQRIRFVLNQLKRSRQQICCWPV